MRVLADRTSLEIGALVVKTGCCNGKWCVIASSLSFPFFIHRCLGWIMSLFVVTRKVIAAEKSENMFFMLLLFVRQPDPSGGWGIWCEVAAPRIKSMKKTLMIGKVRVHFEDWFFFTVMMIFWMICTQMKRIDSLPNRSRIFLKTILLCFHMLCSYGRFRRWHRGGAGGLPFGWNQWAHLQNGGEAQSHRAVRIYISICTIKTGKH